LPVTSVVVRSSVNINANAKSKMSAITHGFLLAITVIVLPSMLNAIPLSCLAAVLIVTGFKLVNPKIFKQAWSQGINQFLPLLVTCVAIIFTDLLIGVLIGLACSILFILRANLKIPNRVIIENHLFGKIRRILLTKQVSFLNRASLSETLEKIPAGTQVIVDASETEYIDADMLDLIIDFKNDRAPKREIALSLVGFKDSYVMKNSIEFVDYSTLELQQNATPDQVLTMLIDGNQRVLEGRRIKRDLNKQISGTAAGQYPLAAILSCIDSRLPVELVFDLGIGDVFSLRMAGNIVSQKVLGGLEFACAVSGAKLILVMGHTKCGAVSAAVDTFFGQTPVNEKYECKHLGFILDEMKKVIEKTWPQIKNDSHVDQNHFLSSVILQNVLHTIHNIKTSSPILARLVDEGKIGIVGCIYDVTTGSAKFLHTDLIAKYEKSSPFLHSPEYIENYLKNPSSLVI
jgi:carbonic anhydrase